MIRIPFLLYHDLDSPDLPNTKTGDAAVETTVRKQDFEAQVRSLVRRGYTAISLTDFMAWRNGLSDLPAKPVILTFDDGHYSNYKLAFPVLTEYGLCGTFFVIADKLDQPGYLTRQQVSEMVHCGMEIGSHGLTHQYLPLLHRNEVIREMRESRKILENTTGRPVNFFAFPGGHYERTHLASLRHCGYTAACSCLQGLNHAGTDPFLLKRIEIRRRVKPEEFERLFEPFRIFCYQGIDAWKRVLRRIVGIERYARLRAGFFYLYPFKR